MRVYFVMWISNVAHWCPVSKWLFYHSPTFLKQSQIQVIQPLLEGISWRIQLTDTVSFVLLMHAIKKSPGDPISGLMSHGALPGTVPNALDVGFTVSSFVNSGIQRLENWIQRCRLATFDQYLGQSVVGQIFFIMFPLISYAQKGCFTGYFCTEP